MALSLNLNISQSPNFHRFDEKKQIETLVNCEKIIFNTTIGFIGKTNNLLNWSDAIFRKTYTSIGNVFCEKYDYKRNPNIVDELLAGQVSNTEISRYLNYGDDDAKIKSIIHSQMNVDTRRNTSSMFVCPKCRKNETYHVDIQMRAADEDSTTNITCAYCSYSWRM
jgi:DNA-directed RNA polymerase subunit M/transcription elongation factor TFIIS